MANVQAQRLLCRHLALAAQRCQAGLSNTCQSTGLTTTLQCMQRRWYADLPAHTKLSMPALSPTMSQGNIAKWYVKEGDEVAPGAVLADIETDKATMAFENQDDGFIAKIVMPEGSKDVPVGATVAIIVEEAESVPAFAEYSEGSSSASSSSSSSSGSTSSSDSSKAAANQATEQAPAKASGSGASYPPHMELCMPALSPTMEQGNIVAWHVKEGDEISAGTNMADIETDKATMSFESQEDGFLAKILVPAGKKDIKVGELVAVMVEDEADVSKFADYTGPSGATSSSSASSDDSSSSGEPGADKKLEQQPKQARVQANNRMGPAARFALAQAGLAPDDVNPTGPNHIITKYDVMAAVEGGAKPGRQAQPSSEAPAPKAAAAAAAAPAAAPKPAAASKSPSAPAKPAAAPAGGSYTDIPNTQVRKIIAERLLQSKKVAPSLYVSADASLDALTALRKELAAAGTKVSVNDFIVRAAALALRDVPGANAFWDNARGEAVKQQGVDVCVAVATEGGLITPIVRDADGKGLLAVSGEVKALAAKARANKLAPHEFQGGTFTISNLGMYGLTQFAAIINPPQAAIMAVGGTQQKVSLQDGKPVASTFMTVTLSADQRVFDGELASQFLTAFCGYIANPIQLVV